MYLRHLGHLKPHYYDVTNVTDTVTVHRPESTHHLRLKELLIVDHHIVALDLSGHFKAKMDEHASFVDDLPNYL